MGINTATSRVFIDPYSVPMPETNMIDPVRHGVLHEGVNELRTGKYREAVDKLKTTLQLDTWAWTGYEPDKNLPIKPNPTILLMLGIAQIGKGDYTGAIDTFYLMKTNHGNDEFIGMEADVGFRLASELHRKGDRFLEEGGTWVLGILQPDRYYRRRIRAGVLANNLDRFSRYLPPHLRPPIQHAYEMAINVAKKGKLS